MLLKFNYANYNFMKEGSNKPVGLQALECMKNIVRNDEVKLDIPSDKPTKFEVELISKESNKAYKYGFEVFEDKILNEWMFIQKDQTFVNIFDRKPYIFKLLRQNKPTDNLVPKDNKTLFLKSFIDFEPNNLDFNYIYNWFWKDEN